MPRSSQSPWHRGTSSHPKGVTMKLKSSFVSIPFASANFFSLQGLTLETELESEFVSIPFASGKSFAPPVRKRCSSAEDLSQSPSHRGTASEKQPLAISCQP